VTRGALGLELYEPIEMGPLVVAGLSASLPGLRFPLDLSGGVPVFRHRRGDLERLELRLEPELLARWLAHRWSEVLGSLDRPASVWTDPGRICFGIVSGARALAFDLIWAPVERDARAVVVSARGAGLGGVALGYALRALDTAFGGFAERKGRTLTVREAGLTVARRVLPPLGARAPSAARARCGELERIGGALRLEIDASFAPAPLGVDAARALELASLVVEADDALARGDPDAARAGYLAALERAPRHPELSALVAEIDLVAGARSEAALGLLVECMPAADAGRLGAELLAATGDLDGAREAIARAARDERFGPLAALWWLRLAELELHAPARFEALDRAVARAPGLEAARWARLRARLGRGDVSGAAADAEHLEAAASGSRRRHEVVRRAAECFAEAGLGRDAARLYERALRYAPDDAAATAGLGRALSELGRGERAIALFERAIGLAERRDEDASDALVELAKLLAGPVADLPGAVARVRQVPAGSPRAIEARGLEARWRARLGDVAGATLAFARLRDAVEQGPVGDARAAADLLQEAASFEREVQHDGPAAERHLAAALRLLPHDRAIGSAYRDAAAVVAARARHEREDGAREAVRAAEPRPPPRERPASDAELAERLEGALRASPGDAAIAAELSDVLERLGRSSELFALLSARLEDATPEERQGLVPRLRQVLLRLIADAEAQGRDEEARLYADALAGLS
jgi:tetratricopeptide (TPR) repeat protein